MGKGLRKQKTMHSQRDSEQKEQSAVSYYLISNYITHPQWQEQIDSGIKKKHRPSLHTAEPRDKTTQL